MIDGSQIRANMEVIGADGRHLGRVDHVERNDIDLTRFEFGSGVRHHLIPLSWVDRVAGSEVRLNRTHEEAKAAWQKAH
jgi:hypothetical protein